VPSFPHPSTLHAPPTSRCRGAGGVGQGIEDFFGGGFGGVNAIGNSDAVKGDPGQREPGVPGQLAPDRLDTVEMAKDVLGDSNRDHHRALSHSTPADIIKK